MRTTTEETRARLGRIASTLASKRGPLAQAELEALRSIFAQFEELETELRSAEEKHYYRAFLNYLRVGYSPSMRQSGISTEDRAILANGRELFSSPTSGTFSPGGQEIRDMGTGGGSAYPGSTVGFFIPALFTAKVASVMKFYSRLLALANVVDTQSGAAQGYPEDSDTVSGEMVPEFAQTTDQDIPVSQTILKSFKFGSRLVKVSMELLQDAGFPLDDYLADRFAIRLARAMNPKFTSGVGGGVEPTGFITRAAIGATAIGSAENSGNADGTNTVGSSDLSNLLDSVDAAYRQDKASVFMMHPSTLGSLRRLRDRNGYPAFDGLHNGDGTDTIFNFRVEMNADMDQLQVSPGSPPVTRKTVAFGRFDKFVIRRAPQILARLDSRFVDQGQIGFLLWQRADSNLIDGGGGAIKVLANVY